MNQFLFKDGGGGDRSKVIAVSFAKLNSAVINNRFEDRGEIYSRRATIAC